MKLILTRSLSEPVAAVVLCTSMDLLAVVTRKGSLSVYAVGQPQPIFTVNLLVVDGPGGSSVAGATDSEDSSTCCSCLAWTPNGRLLAVGFQTPLVCIVCVEKGEVLRRFRAQNVFDPSDHVLATRSGSWPISLRTDEGVLLAAWKDHSVSSTMASVGTVECLPLPSSKKTIAAILEDSWKQSTISVLILLGVKGTVSILIGGIREVWSRSADFPELLRQSIVAARPNSQNSIVGQVVTSSEKGELIFSVKTATEGNSLASHPHDEAILVLPLGGILADLVHPITVANCLIKEYEGIAVSNITKVANSWSTTVAGISSQFQLSRFVSLLRDTLIDSLASPDHAVLLQFLGDLRLAKIVSVAENLREVARSCAAAVIRTSYVAFDAAIELSARAGMTSYSSRIKSLRRSCGEFLTLMTTEGQHYELLLRWLIVIVQAKTATSVASDPVLAQSKSFALQAPLASQYIFILHLLNALVSSVEPNIHHRFVTDSSSAQEFLNCASRYSTFLSQAAAAHWSEEDVTSSFALRSSTSFAFEASTAPPLAIAVLDWSSAIRSTSVRVLSVSFYTTEEDHGINAAVVATSGGESARAVGSSTTILLASFVVSSGGLELACGPSPLDEGLGSVISKGQVSRCISSSGFLDGSHVLLAVKTAADGGSQPATTDGVAVLRVLQDGSPFTPDEDCENEGENCDGEGDEDHQHQAGDSTLQIDGLRTGGVGAACAHPRLNVCASRGFAVVSCGPQFAVIDFSE